MLDFNYLPHTYYIRDYTSSQLPGSTYLLNMGHLVTSAAGKSIYTIYNFLPRSSMVRRNDIKSSEFVE